jgi:hypothetical protein
VGGVVLHFRSRNDNGARRRGGGHEDVTLVPTGLHIHRGGGGIAAGAGCADHVAVGGSETSGWNAAARARWRWGVDGTDWGERRGEVPRDVGVESAGAASFMHVKGPVQ